VDDRRRTSLLEAADDISDSVFGQVLDNFFGQPRARYWTPTRLWNPPTDVFETSTAIIIKMELAGVLREDIEVKTSGSFLMIRGKRVDQHKVKKENFHLMEIHYGHFMRTFRLAGDMAIGEVNAELENGFLTVSIPKGQPGREIRINID
jgi:HSP20 family protein